MTGAELLAADDATFQVSWMALSDAERAALPDAERARGYERIRRLTAYVTRSIERLASQQEKKDAARARAALPVDNTRPQIEWCEGNLHEIVDAAENAVIGSGEPIYQRGELIVRVVRRAPVSSRNFRRAGGAVGLVIVDVPYLVDALTRIAAWVRFDRRAGALRAINAPDRVAATYLARVGEWHLPRLWAVIDTPTLRPDGSILQQPGYDLDTAILYDPGAIEYPMVPDRPSRADAQAAIEHLTEAVGTFPFVDDVDRSVALAGFMGSLVRRSLPAAPLYGITAPVMGSGKTLLADCIAIVATGVSAPVMTDPASEEEAGKLLLSVLAEGEGVVLIDNIEAALGGAWLCAALTSESFSGRILGRNAMAKVPTACTWLVTGNQLVLIGDLRTRALLCRLDPRCEHPEEREFVGDLREEIAERRADLVVAALTVMRAFAVSGARASDLVRPWGRFEAWSERVRAPLVWVGQPDPCASLKQLEREDPERERLITMLRAWHAAFGANPATGREAIDHALRVPEMREAMEPVARDRSGQLDPLRLGRWLHKAAGRIAAGYEFERAGERQGSALWQVKTENGARGS